MRPRVFVTSLLLATAGACTQPSSDLSDTALDELTIEVRAVTDSLVLAMNAHDSDQFEALFELDARFMYGSCTSFSFGGDQFAAVTRAYHRNQDVVVEVQDKTVRILGPDAAVAAVQWVSSDSAASNPILTTNVLTKGNDGGWRIVHQHQSWPGCSPPKGPHSMTTAPDDEVLEAGDRIG